MNNFLFLFLLLLFILPGESCSANSVKPDSGKATITDDLSTKPTLYDYSISPNHQYNGVRFIDPYKHSSSYLIEPLTPEANYMHEEVNEILDLIACQEVLQASNDAQAGIDCFNQYIEKYPASTKARYTLGRIYLMLIQKGYDSAVNDIENLVKNAHYQFSLVLRYNPLHDEALQLLEQIESFWKNDRGTTNLKAFQLYQKALQTFAMKQLDETITTLQEAVDLDPTYLDAWVQLVLTQINLGQFTQAKQTIDQLFGKFPKNYLLYYVYSIWEERQNHFDEAKTLAVHSVAARPDFFQGWRQLCNVYLLQKRHMKRFVLQIPMELEETKHGDITIKTTKKMTEQENASWMPYGLIYLNYATHPESIRNLEIPQTLADSPDIVKVLYAGLKSTAQTWKDLKAKHRSLSNAYLDVLMQINDLQLLEPFIFLDYLFNQSYTYSFYEGWKNNHEDKIIQYLDLVLTHPIEP